MDFGLGRGGKVLSPGFAFHYIQNGGSTLT